MTSLLRRNSHQIFINGVLVLTLGAYALFALKYPLAYLWATYEDLPGEWVQTFFFLVTGVCALRLVLAGSQYRWFFGLLALACLYTFMEEISWGQRILGFESPSLFKLHNLQSETNLHNVLSGPFVSPMKDSLRYMIAAGLVTYGLLFPLMYRRRTRPGVWLHECGLAPAPLYLAPAFVAAAILELEQFHFNEAEIAELLVGFSLSVMSVHYNFAETRGVAALRSREWPPGASLSLTMQFYVLISAIILSAAVATLGMHGSASRSAKISQRIDNGIEKFAERYTKYERWDLAIALYARLRAGDPDNTYLLRRLATVHGMAGECGEHQSHLKLALKLDRERYREKSSSAKLNRSLSRTYGLLGDSNKASYHAERALTLGRNRVASHPDSAYAAYSLGLSYALKDQDGEAMQQFERAYRLHPLSKRYRKAYLKAKQRAEGDAGKVVAVNNECLQASG